MGQVGEMMGSNMKKINLTDVQYGMVDCGLELIIPDNDKKFKEGNRVKAQYKGAYEVLGTCDAVVTSISYEEQPDAHIERFATIEKKLSKGPTKELCLTAVQYNIVNRGERLLIHNTVREIDEEIMVHLEDEDDTTIFRPVLTIVDSVSFRPLPYGVKRFITLVKKKG